MHDRTRRPLSSPCPRNRATRQRGKALSDGTSLSTTRLGPTRMTLTLAPASVPKHVRGFLLRGPAHHRFAWHTLDADDHIGARGYTASSHRHRPKFSNLQISRKRGGSFDMVFDGRPLPPSSSWPLNRLGGRAPHIARREMSGPHISKNLWITPCR
jgi:hypothetical protein